MIDGTGYAVLANDGPPAPSAAASGMPCTLPVGDVDGRFRSPCASIQSAAPGPCALAIPPSVPIAIEWSPPRTSGMCPRCVASLTFSAICSQTRMIGPR